MYIRILNIPKGIFKINFFINYIKPIYICNNKSESKFVNAKKKYLIVRSK